jgi:hypothetical protein
MSISTNSVIHYTERIENLKGILLHEGFRLKYCYEELLVCNENLLSSAIPMVSFCDIPLSEVKNHVDAYGSYGIGLNKSWARRTGLNPVFYLEMDSQLARLINEQVNRIMKNLDKKRPSKEDMHLRRDLITYISYCKNYEGKLTRGKLNTETYRFYNEREWRYIGNSEDLSSAPRIIFGEDYKQNKEKYNSDLENCFVRFSHEDISYIIVDSENEIPEILSTLYEIYEDKCTTKELKILSTRIITQNQIYNDF